jgi:hypothetical protein
MIVAQLRGAEFKESEDPVRLDYYDGVIPRRERADLDEAVALLPATAADYNIAAAVFDDFAQLVHPAALTGRYLRSLYRDQRDLLKKMRDTIKRGPNGSGRTTKSRLPKRSPRRRR